MQKIKILLLGNISPKFDKVKGGVEAVVYNLIEGFNACENIEVILISFQKEVSAEYKIQFSKNIQLCFIPYRFSKFELLDYFFNTGSVKKIMSEFRPDIVHIQGASTQLLRFFRFNSQRIIVTQHGIAKEEFKYVSGIKHKLTLLFKMVVEKYYFPFFENIIFISNYNKNLYAGNLKNSVIIYNPINSVFFKERSVYCSNMSITYSGVISYRKNIKTLIEALRVLKSRAIIFELHVVGDFTDIQYKNYILGLIEKYGLVSQIKFHGWLNQEGLKNILNQSAYFVLPSKQETLPVSIAEAMAMGKIVIASNVGAVSEMIEDGVSGFLIEPNDFFRLAERLEFLYHNRELSLQISKQAYIKALQKYHTTGIIKETIDFYNKVIITHS